MGRVFNLNDRVFPILNVRINLFLPLVKFILYFFKVIDDFETESGYYGTTPLYAVCAGNVDLVKTLVREFRADIRHSDELGRNALNTAKDLTNEHPDSDNWKEIYEFLCKNIRED